MVNKSTILLNPQFNPAAPWPHGVVILIIFVLLYDVDFQCMMKTVIKKYYTYRLLTHKPVVILIDDLSTFYVARILIKNNGCIMLKLTLKALYNALFKIYFYIIL